MKLLDVTKDFWEISTKEPTISLGRHIIKPVSNIMACRLIHMNLLVKITTKLFLIGIIFLLFLYNFAFVLSFLCFPREVFGIMYEDFLYGYYSIKFSGKVLPVTLTLLFFSLIDTYQAFFEWRKQKSFKRKKSVRKNCCHLNVLKLLLMHLFVPLLINSLTH